MGRDLGLPHRTARLALFDLQIWASSYPEARRSVLLTVPVRYLC